MKNYKYREAVAQLAAIEADAMSAAKADTGHQHLFEEIAAQAAKNANDIRQDLDEGVVDYRKVSMMARIWEATRELLRRVVAQIWDAMGVVARAAAALVGAVAGAVLGFLDTLMIGVARLLDIFTGVLSFFGVGRPHAVEDWVRGRGAPALRARLDRVTKAGCYEDGVLERVLRRAVRRAERREYSTPKTETAAA